MHRHWYNCVLCGYGNVLHKISLCLAICLGMCNVRTEGIINRSKVSVLLYKIMQFILLELCSVCWVVLCFWFIMGCILKSKSYREAPITCWSSFARRNAGFLINWSLIGSSIVFVPFSVNSEIEITCGQATNSVHLTSQPASVMFEWNRRLVLRC